MANVNKNHSVIVRFLILLISSAPLAYNATAATDLSHSTTTPSDSIIIKRAYSGRSHKLKLFAKSKHAGLYFTAQGKTGKCYQLFLFNMDGKLIQQSNIQEKQMASLTEMEKGSYLFEVFNEDLRIENGSIVIK